MAAEDGDVPAPAADAPLRPVTSQPAIAEIRTPAASAEGLRKRKPLTPTEQRNERDSQLVAAAAAADAPTLAVVFQQAAPVLNILGQVVNTVGPAYAHAFRLGVRVYHEAPLDLIQAAAGLGLCFFGGAFCTTIAAAEAFNLVTWSTTRQSLEEIYQDVVLIREAHEADEKKDEDGDGTADVKQCTPSEFAQRKLRVALLAVRDPHRLSVAVGGVYAGWLAVVATLRMNFAKTVTLGVSLATMLDEPATRYGVPILAHLVPPEFHRWLPVAVRTLVKAVAVAFAWYLQVLLAAVQSALRGGLMCSRATLRWAGEHGLISPLKEEDTYIAEVAGYALALMGCYCQWSWGFSAPFPLNILLMPFTLVEWTLRWSVVGGAVGGGAA